jgi:hypothetical protein
MRLRLVAALAIAALCGAVTGGAASADDDTADSRRAPAAEPAAPSQGANLYPLKSVPLGGRTFEELIAERSGSMTPEEAAAAVAESERNSSTVDFYPNSPDDPRVDPPVLDDNGDD